MATVHVRPPQTFPNHTEECDTVCLSSKAVYLKHPAYEENENLLLLLNAPDGPTGGIHHDTARTACGIIAGNRWDGYFAEKPGGEPILASAEALLPPGAYYFHVPNPERVSTQLPYRYPVVPNFQHWQFPPRGQLPPTWEMSRISVPSDTAPMQSSDMTTILAARDISCRMTLYNDGYEKAHLVPSADDVWFDKNAQLLRPPGIFTPVPNLKSMTTNIMLLRNDMHTLFDKGYFVFVPKHRQFVTHAFNNNPQLIMLHQNVPLPPLKGLSVECLFARFAWTIFPVFGNEFLKSGWSDRAVLLLEERKVRELSHIDCVPFLARPQSSRSRSNSPKKQQPHRNGQQRSAAAQLGILDPEIGAAYNASIQATDATSVSSQGPSETFDRKSLASSSEDLFPDPVKNPPAENLTLEEKIHYTLRYEALAKERAQSDPGGAWESEIQWMSKNRFGPFVKKELIRAEMNEGFEYFDPEDEIWKEPLDFDDGKEPTEAGNG